MKKISEKVEELISLYKTRSPFMICEKLNINIIFVDLPKSTDGLFVKTKYDEKMILISKNMPPEKVKRTCAHELAHAVLHKDINALQLEGNCAILKKLDEEAELFSSLLLG